MTATGRVPEPGELRHRSTTDHHGRYRLRDIPRRAIDGKPLEARLSVTKEGYGGVQLPLPSLADGDPEQPIVVEPIRLKRGVSISGTVADHRGRPAAGASVEAIQPPARSGGVPQSTRTDENGSSYPGLAPGRDVTDRVPRKGAQGWRLSCRRFRRTSSHQASRACRGTSRNIAVLPTVRRGPGCGSARAGLAGQPLVGSPRSPTGR